MVSAILGVIDKLGPLILPLRADRGGDRRDRANFGQAWDAVQKAVDEVYDAIKKVVEVVSKAANAVAGFLSHIPHVPGRSSSAPALRPAPRAPTARAPTPRP